MHEPRDTLYTWKLTHISIIIYIYIIVYEDKHY